MDVTKVVTLPQIPPTDDGSLPTVNTNLTSPPEVSLTPNMTALLKSPPMQQTVADSGTVSSGLTLDTVATRMDAVEGSVATVKTNMAEVQNTLNQTNHMMRQLCMHLNLTKEATEIKDPSGSRS